MKVAVVTPVYQPNYEHLQKCIQSVVNQTHHDCFHVIVNDGSDQLSENIDSSVHCIQLPHNFNDFGDSPRAIGTLYAFAKGADAVCFLDDDNWYLPDHIAHLIETQKRHNTPFVSSLRMLASFEGDIFGPCMESDGYHFCDTNAMFFMREVANIAMSWWETPPELHVIGDRVMWDNIVSSNIRFSCTDKPTVVYRTRFAHHYKLYGKAIPEDAIDGSYISAQSAKIEELQQRAKEFAQKNFIGNKN